MAEWVYREVPVLLPAETTFALKLTFGGQAWPRKGDRVVIPKGTTVFSTYPDWPMEGKPAGRSYEVTVHRVDNWSQGEEKAKVNWGGTAGYWKWCKLCDVKEPPSDLEKLARVSSKRTKG